MRAVEIICGHQNRVASARRSATGQLEANRGLVPERRSAPDVGLDAVGPTPHGVSSQLDVPARAFAAIRTLARKTRDLHAEKADRVVHAIEMICAHQSALHGRSE